MALLLNAGNTVSRSYSYTQPSPLHPIQPQGTGERTGNLCPVSTWTNSQNTDTKTFFQLSITLYDGTTSLGERRLDVRGTGRFALTSATAGENGATRLSVKHNGSTRDLAIVVVYGDFPPNQQLTISFDASGYDPTVIGGISISNIMVNEGSTALPYEPYGIKIPILSAGQTTPVYLGETQTTRKIKKLVLDGTEDWNSSYSGNNKFFTVAVSANGRDSSNIMSTHFIYANIASNTTAIGVRLADGTTLRIRPDNVSAMNVTDWKTYLQQQYAAGTPVTVWYVLATPETVTINEPLMKIGDYADEVSGISIPVTAGGDTISIGTTLQPSEVTVNYKGWHPVADVHERSRNLLNKNDTNTANGYIANHYLDVSGNEISYSNLYNLYNISTYIEVEPNTTYTLSDGNTHVTPAICEYTDAKVFITGHSFNNLDAVTFTTSATTKFVRASVFLTKPNATSISQPMLNAGSTVLPYEPYWI